MAELRYKEALAYLEGLEAFGTVFGLGRIKKACALLGNPQDSFKCAHAAGTNGKGSVCAMLESVLRAAGYKTALYTSPHIKDIRERILVNGEMISKNDFADAVLKVREIDSHSSIGLTHFEALTAAAFLQFRKAGVEFAVIETGMGGRLDATNVVKPEVAVITNVELEHTEYLGKTVQEIAHEKAGIIKEGCAVVAGKMEKDALEVIENECAKKRCSLAVAGKDIRIFGKSRGLGSTEFGTEVFGRKIENLRIHLRGSHQLINAGCAIGAIDALRKRGFNISDGALRSGLEKARWAGRFEVFSKRPLLVADAAHNPAGMRTLTEALQQYFLGKKFVFVLGTASDKDIKGIVDEIAKHDVASAVFAAEASHRAMDAGRIAEEMGKHGIECIVEKQPRVALQKALKISERAGEGVCVAGSIFLLSDLWDLLNKNRKKQEK